MKRKISGVDNEESRLSNLLFNKSKKFADNLPAQTKSETDVDIKPVWIDEDDEAFTVANTIPNTKSDGLYTQKLKQKYETLIGKPGWAKLKEKKEEGDETKEDTLLGSVGHLKKPAKHGLKKNILEVKLFPKINNETHIEGPLITNVKFHPRMSVALVAGTAGVVSLFSIGKESNNKLHSFKLKNFKVSSAHFTPDGSEAYISSNFDHNYCIYDLVKAEPKLVQLPKVIKRPKSFVLSPNGKFIATSGGFDEVYIICPKSKELIRSLKHNTNVESLTFSHDSTQLYSYGVQGNVTIWDMSTFRAQNKFYDQGCITASCIATSPCGRLLATGSGEGIVNIYDSTNLTANSIPLKTVSNLRTKITNLTFNATTEILSVSSSFYPNAVKLVHIPSYHVFSNFPAQNLHQIQTVSFSPNSGYMALGDNKGSAYLYRLKHFKNY